MKLRLLTTILLILFAVSGYGQGNTVYQSATNTTVQYNGGLGATKRQIIPIYTDTTAANVYYSTYPNFTKSGNIIYTSGNNSFWVSNGSAWLRLPDYATVQSMISSGSGLQWTDTNVLATQYFVLQNSGTGADSTIYATIYRDDTGKVNIRSSIPTNNNQLTNGANYVTNSTLSINGKITAGTNVSFTGSGTTTDPYVVNSSGGGGGTTTNSLTLGRGLNGGTFNGSAAVTASLDTNQTYQFLKREAFVRDIVVDSIYGGVSSGDSLTLKSNTSANGKIYFGDRTGMTYDEANKRLGLGTASPGVNVHIEAATTPTLLLNSTGTGNNGRAAFTLGRAYPSTTGWQFLKDANDDLIMRELTAGVTDEWFIWRNTNQVGIGTLTPDASAAVDIPSTTRGFLPPRMSSTQMNAISSPAAGLMLYENTNSRLKYRGASAWLTPLVDADTGSGRPIVTKADLNTAIASVSTPNLSSVLTVGNSAGNQTITDVEDVQSSVFTLNGVTDQLQIKPTSDFSTTREVYVRDISGTMALTSDTAGLLSKIDDKVTGPASATDNAIAVYKGTSGDTIQNSAVTINSGTINATGAVNGTNFNASLGLMLLNDKLVFSYPNSPEGNQAANPGSLALTSEGKVYKKATGTGNTGWEELGAGGGGGSSDSSWMSISIGTEPELVGTLFQTNFSGTSAPTGITAGTNIGVGYNNRAYIVGSQVWGKPGVGDQTTPWKGGLQYNLSHMAHEKLDVTITLIPKSKVSGGKVGIVKGNNGLLSTLSESIIWDLGDGYYSGTVGLGLDSNITQGDSVQKLAWSVNDTLELYFRKDGVFNTSAGIRNITTGETTKSLFTGFWAGSGGLWNFVFIKDSFQVLSVKVNSFHRKNVPLWVGDSQLGYGVTSESNRPVSLVYRNNYDYFNQVCLPSVEGKYVRSSKIIREWLHEMKPSAVIHCWGYNDESQLSGAPNFKTDLDSMITWTIDSSAVPYVMGIVPRNATTDAYDDSAQALSAQRSVVFFNIRDALTDANGRLFPGYSFDDIHTNNTGAYRVFETTVATPGFDLLNVPNNDTIPNAYWYSAKTIETPDVMQVFGRTSDGKTGWGKSPYVTPKDYIPNVYSTAQPRPSDGYPLRRYPNTAVATPLPVYSDSAFIQGGTQGLNIGYQYASKANISITNLTSGGLNYGHVFPTYATAANGNTVIHNITSKGSYTSTINGSYNTFLGPNSGVGTVDGSSNININAGAGPTTISSGSNNIVFSDKGGQTTSSNAILLGTNGSGWGNYAGRILMGNFSNGVPAAGSVIAFQPITNGAITTYLGAYAQYSGSITHASPLQFGSNTNGIAVSWVASAGNGTGTDGGLAFKSFAPSNQSTPITTLIIQDNKATFGGAIVPASIADANAPNNSVYYSTDASKLVYKDAGGVVNNLY